MNEVKSSGLLKEPEHILSNRPLDKPDMFFEYTGNNSLRVTGNATGNSYHFRFKGDKTQVDYHDSFALMAEQDLKFSSK